MIAAASRPNSAGSAEAVAAAGDEVTLMAAAAPRAMVAMMLHDMKRPSRRQSGHEPGR